MKSRLINDGPQRTFAVIFNRGKISSAASDPSFESKILRQRRSPAWAR